MKNVYTAESMWKEHCYLFKIKEREQNNSCILGEYGKKKKKKII